MEKGALVSISGVAYSISADIKVNTRSGGVAQLVVSLPNMTEAIYWMPSLAFTGCGGVHLQYRYLGAGCKELKTN